MPPPDDDNLSSPALDLLDLLLLPFPTEPIADSQYEPNLVRGGSFAPPNMRQLGHEQSIPSPNVPSITIEYFSTPGIEPLLSPNGSYSFDASSLFGSPRAVPPLVMSPPFPAPPDSDVVHQYLTGDASPTLSIYSDISLGSPHIALSPIASPTHDLHSSVNFGHGYSSPSDSPNQILDFSLRLSLNSPSSSQTASSPDVSSSPSFLTLPLATLPYCDGVDSPQAYSSSPEIFPELVLFEPVNGAGEILFPDAATTSVNAGISRRRAHSVGECSLPVKVVRAHVGTDRMTEVGKSRRLRSNSTGKYACVHCTNTFTSKDNLEYHNNSHLGRAPYKCRYCEKAFKGKGDRNRHEKRPCPKKTQ